MKKFLIVPIIGMITLAATTIQAQQRFSDAQLLRGLPSDLTAPTSQVLGWLDDSRLLFNGRPHPDSPQRRMVLDCKTGKETAASVDMRLPQAEAPARSVYVSEEDLFLRDGSAPAVRLTQTPGREQNPILFLKRK